MSIIRLIADDLTGALDAGVHFSACASGLRVIVAEHYGPVPIAPNASGAISTESRERGPDAARRLARAAAPFLRGADIRFVKIDSLLRGNWPTILAELLAAFPEHTCIFAPAFPAQQRLTEGGRQIAPLPDGGMAPLPLVPRAALAGAGLRAALLPRGAKPYPSPGSVLICDARQDADLERLVAACKRLRGEMLWCGSAGLARALAGAPPPAVSLDARPPLVIVGSNHPVTERQLALLPHASTLTVPVGTDSTRAIALINQHSRAAPCVVSVSLPLRLPARAAAAIIAERLTAVVPALPPPARLVVIGGETLAAVCRAVGAEALLLEGEWQPGAPGSRIAGGLWHDVPVISRSGAFGGPDFFRELLASPPPDAPIRVKISGRY